MENRYYPRDVLNESEAALRMMDAIVAELQGGDDQSSGSSDADVAMVMERLEAASTESADLSALVMHVYLDVIDTLRVLRRTRSALERTTVEQVQATQEKLREVSSTTEIAATDMLDGLDRAIGMIDQLDAVVAEGKDEAEAARIRGDLREELYRLIVVLQFQDIAAQQLSHAASVLRNVEKRLERVVGLLDEPGQLPEKSPEQEGDPHHAAHESAPGFDPAASMHDAEDRQALADEIFTPASDG